MLCRYVITSVDVWRRSAGDLFRISFCSLFFSAFGILYFFAPGLRFYSKGHKSIIGSQNDSAWAETSKKSCRMLLLSPHSLHLKMNVPQFLFYLFSSSNTSSNTSSKTLVLHSSLHFVSLCIPSFIHLFSSLSVPLPFLVHSVFSFSACTHSFAMKYFVVFHSFIYCVSALCHSLSVW